MEYRQLRVISGKGDQPHQFASALRGIALDGADLLYAVGDSVVKVFDAEGSLRGQWNTGKPGYCVAVGKDGTVYVGQEGRIEIYAGEEVGSISMHQPGGVDMHASQRIETHPTAWDDPQRLGLVTAITVTADHVLIADARERCLRRYDRSGKFLNNIGRQPGRRGFLIPNGVLDFAVDDQGVIHAANPGKHRVERYTAGGELLGHFGRFDGQNPEGFPGCCNPTNITVTGSGGLIVTEKAGPRVKAYTAEGKLLAVIADDVFDPNCKNMDVAVDSKERVYVVDTARLQICVFAPDQSRPVLRPERSDQETNLRTTTTRDPRP